MKKVVSFVLGLTLVASASPVLAQMEKADPERRALFVSLLEQNGCSMDDKVAAEVMPANDFAKPEIELIVTELALEKLVRAEGETLVLMTETCQ